jgi:hypothetical protein
MTLPNVLDKANWQKLQFEWRGPSYEDLSSHKVGRAIGTGFMIAGYVQDPCPFGMHGFHQLPWDNFPVIVEFPDIANDPFFIGSNPASSRTSIRRWRSRCEQRAARSRLRRMCRHHHRHRPPTCRPCLDVRRVELQRPLALANPAAGSFRSNEG